MRSLHGFPLSPLRSASVAAPCAVAARVEARCAASMARIVANSRRRAPTCLRGGGRAGGWERCSERLRGLGASIEREDRTRVSREALFGSAALTESRTDDSDGSCTGVQDAVSSSLYALLQSPNPFRMDASYISNTCKLHPAFFRITTAEPLNHNHFSST